MRSRMQVLSALVAVAIGAVGLSSTAHAANLSKVQLKCQKTIGKEGAKFVNGQLKVRQKCINSNLTNPGSCTSVDVSKLEAKLASAAAVLATVTPGCVDRLDVTLPAAPALIRVVGCV